MERPIMSTYAFMLQPVGNRIASIKERCEQCDQRECECGLEVDTDE